MTYRTVSSRQRKRVVPLFFDVGHADNSAACQIFQGSEKPRSRNSKTQGPPGTISLSDEKMNRLSTIVEVEHFVKYKVQFRVFLMRCDKFMFRLRTSTIVSNFMKMPESLQKRKICCCVHFLIYERLYM